MADAAAPPKVAAGEVRVDLSKLGGDIADAGDALTGLFAEGDAPADTDTEIQQEPETEPADTGGEETPPTGDHEDGPAEPSEGAAIEAPVSWSAEDKKVFEGLPPEAQQVVLRRESERDKLLSTHGQQAAEKQRQLDAAIQQAATERAQQATLLQGVINQILPEFEQYQKIDWDTLAKNSPAEWAQKFQAWNSLNQRLVTAQQQVQSLTQAQQVEQQKQHQTLLTTEHQRLVERVPEFADKAKLQAFGQDLTKHLTELTPAELSTIADHRYLLIARDAMKWRQAEAARKTAQDKRVPAAQGSKPPLRAQARQGSAGDDARAREVQALHGNLRKSGRLEDAAALLVRSGAIQ